MPKKKIDFPKMIGEITAISLDHNLKFIDDYNIEGNLIVSGNYKLTEASVIEEEFNYKLPTEKHVDKTSELVKNVKVWVDSEYAAGRVTVLTDEELALLHKSANTLKEVISQIDI